MEVKMVEKLIEKMIDTVNNYLVLEKLALEKENIILEDALNYVGKTYKNKGGKDDEPVEPAKAGEPVEPAKAGEPVEPAKAGEPVEPIEEDERQKILNELVKLGVLKPASARKSKQSTNTLRTKLIKVKKRIADEVGTSTTHEDIRDIAKETFELLQKKGVAKKDAINWVLASIYRTSKEDAIADIKNENLSTVVKALRSEYQKLKNMELSEEYINARVKAAADHAKRKAERNAMLKEEG